MTLAAQCEISLGWVLHGVVLRIPKIASRSCIEQDSSRFRPTSCGHRRREWASRGIEAHEQWKSKSITPDAHAMRRCIPSCGKQSLKEVRRPHSGANWTYVVEILPRMCTTRRHVRSETVFRIGWSLKCQSGMHILIRTLVALTADHVEHGLKRVG